jgi:hypothetical protein
MSSIAHTKSELPAGSKITENGYAFRVAHSGLVLPVGVRYYMDHPTPPPRIVPVPGGLFAVEIWSVQQRYLSQGEHATRAAAAEDLTGWLETWAKNGAC